MFEWLATEFEQKKKEKRTTKKPGLCNHTNELGYLRKSLKAT